jgi:nucleoside-diphosphate-sugar epimerase
MKIILTGRKGFLGSNIYQQMSAMGHKIHNINYRPKEDHIFVPYLEKTIKSIRPDVIINAGASQNGNDDPSAMRELVFSNILLPSYFAWGINNYIPKCLLITFGSAWQYFKGEQLPFNAYAATKTAADTILENYTQDGLRAVSLVLNDTYGPKDKRNKIINLIADAFIHREVLNMSGGDQQIDLIHINDVVAAIVRVIEILRNYDDGCLLKYSVSSGEPLLVRELIKIMSQHVNVKTKDLFNLGYYPYHKRERFIVKSHLPPVPGWEPKVNLSDGLSDLLLSRK